MPGKTVAKVIEPVEVLQAWGLEIPEDEGGDDVSDLIIGKILATQGAKELLTPSGAPSMGSLSGQPIIIHNVRRRTGGMNKKIGFYLLLDVENQSTGERAVYSTGAANIVAQVTKAWHDELLPLRCMVIEVESKSNAGQFVHWLVEEDAPF